MNIATAKINLKNLQHNIDYLKSITNNSNIYPVIKANAYGHGLEKIAIALQNYEIKGVCVATINEIIQLLNLDVEYSILHLGKISYSNLDIYKNNNVIATINSIDEITKLSSIYKNKENKSIRAHIKVDTGMSRMGCNLDEFEDVLNKCIDSPFLKIEGIYSHLANSDNKNVQYNNKQINLFNKILNKYLKNNIFCIHLLNSGGLFNYNKYTYNIVRIGLAIYGISPLGKPNDNLKPVMEFIAPVILTKNIKKNTMVGYGCSYTAKSNMKIGIVQCGYGDGIPFNFSNKGHVYFKNCRINIIGRVSMDLITIDLTNISCDLNDWVTIWGGSTEDSRLEIVASFHKNIPYTYLTGVTNRVLREYIYE